MLEIFSWDQNIFEIFFIIWRLIMKRQYILEQMCNGNTEMLNWISQIHWKIFTIDWLTVSTLQSPNIPLPLGAHRGTPWPPKTPKISWVHRGTQLGSSYLPIRRGFMQKNGKKQKYFLVPPVNALCSLIITNLYNLFLIIIYFSRHYLTQSSVK